ncbi:MAG: lantibiotic dehydratase C-terminal domain-containing protein [Acidobacteriota bacterium]
MKPLSAWKAFHVYYHEDRRRLLNDGIQPLIADLKDRNLVGRWFFVLYGLGGPHVRLRLECSGPPSALDDRVETSLGEFLSTTPSEQALDSTVALQITERLCAGDPNESDTTLYPDNHLRPAPFLPEVERYGGAEGLDAHLTLFAASSRRALRHHGQFAQASRARRYTDLLSALLDQALGLANNVEHASALLGYAEAWWGDSYPTMVEKARHVAGSQGEVLAHLLSGRLDSAEGSLSQNVGSAEDSGNLFIAGRRFREELAEDHSLPDASAFSQLHMTANRFAVGNPEEVYVACLARSILGDAGDASRQRLGKIMAARFPGRSVAKRAS